MSSHPRRRGAVLPAVARFHGEEARGCAGPQSGSSRMARRLKVLVGSSCCGVAVLLPVHDSVRNHPMQRTRGHRHAWWRARGPRAFDRGRSSPSLSLAAWVISRSDMQSGDLQRVIEVVEGDSWQAQTLWAHRGRVQRQGLEGLDAMSSHLRR